MAVIPLECEDYKHPAQGVGGSNTGMVGGDLLQDFLDAAGGVLVPSHERRWGAEVVHQVAENDFGEEIGVIAENVGRRGPLVV